MENQDQDQVFTHSQFVPRPRPEVFAFFSAAENLERITPPFLNFRIQKKSTPQIQEKTLIDYRLKIHGVPITWRTLIEKWVPDSCFVDTQLKGPYTKWHHTHTFEDVPGGTMMHDRVLYRVPFGSLGQLFLGKFIRRDVANIFAYRTEQIEKIFADSSGENHG